MSIQIPDHFVEQYRDNVIMLAQQEGSRLRGAVMNDGNIVGRSVYYDRIGPTAAVKATTRHGDTPLVDTPHSRRKAELEDYDWADLIDHNDRARMIYDPAGKYVKNAAAAFGRTIDEVIIKAATGTVLEGQSGGTSVSFPSANIIASGGNGLTLAKLREARKKLKQAEVFQNVPWYFVCSAAQIDDLLGDTNVTSADYNTVKTLVDGEVNQFLGFTFIQTELLPKVSGERQCLAFAQSGIGLGFAEDVTVDIGPRRDKRMSIQVYMSMSLAALRVEDAQVLRVDCTEA